MEKCYANYAVGKRNRMERLTVVSSKIIQGSKNYQLSSIKDLDASKPHVTVKTAKDVRKAGLSILPRKVVQQITSTVLLPNPCSRWTTKIGKLSKLHNTAYYIALHGLLFTQFEHHIHLEKLHNVSYTGAYENETTCKNVILDISDNFFEEDIKWNWSILLLFCVTDLKTRAGSGGNFCNLCITEQEVIYVVYVDPEKIFQLWSSLT